MFVFSSKITFFGLIIAQLALVFVLSGLVHKLSAGMATTLFMLYSALTGFDVIQYFYRLHLFLHRQHVCGDGGNVWRHEPVWVHH